MMGRLSCVLLIEPDMPEGVSTRKLVLETAHFNVLSAYTSHSALASFEDFPHVDAIVIHSEMRDISYTEVIRRIREEAPNMRVVIVTPRHSDLKPEVNTAVVDSYDASSLLFLMREWFAEQIDND